MRATALIVTLAALISGTLLGSAQASARVTGIARVASVDRSAPRPAPRPAPRSARYQPDTIRAEPLTTTATAILPRRLRALDWARTQRGCWYSWGGVGPCGAGYDCSGLVQAAYRHVGISLPRTTYEMLASPKLVRVTIWKVRRGDLAFYGSGHVELVNERHEARWHWTFGAHDQRSPVGPIHWGPGWHPTAFFRVRHAG